MSRSKRQLQKSPKDSALYDRPVTSVGVKDRHSLETADQIGTLLQWSRRDTETGRFRTMLYRFMARQIPAVSSCLWTWVRLSASPGRFRIIDGNSSSAGEQAERRLSDLLIRLYHTGTDNPAGLSSFLTELFASLYRDGQFGGFLTVLPDGSGVDRFIPVDSIDIRWEEDDGPPRLALEKDEGSIDLSRPDFYHIPLNGTVSQPQGQSILHSIGFVSRIEQQLVDDMQRSSHNAGYHRLHVKVKPPERMSGESDQAYVERINSYFDSTVDMIKGCGVDENPVTWDNVLIEQLGPENSRSVTNSWFFNHRAMIEEICAGTNLAPFLLGYSYGATATWSGFKFEMVMRQVRSIQTEVAYFLEWIARVDLALAGLDVRARFEFDNSMAYQATDEAAIDSKRVDNLTKLYESGLIDKETASRRAEELI